MARLIRNTEQISPDSNLQKFLAYGEEVRPIPNYCNYFATSCGRIFSAKKKVEYRTINDNFYSCVIWRELKQRKIRGYWAVNIMSGEGKKETKYVHFLIYISFTSAFFDKNVLKIVHRDHNKLNNNLGNLAVQFRRKKDYSSHKNFFYRAEMYNDIDKNLIDYSSQTTTPFTKK